MASGSTLGCQGDLGAIRGCRGARGALGGWQGVYVLRNQMCIGGIIQLLWGVEGIRGHQGCIGGLEGSVGTQVSALV